MLFPNHLKGFCHTKINFKKLLQNNSLTFSNFKFRLKDMLPIKMVDLIFYILQCLEINYIY